MAENKVYLVTGANRGIGLALVSLLLQRPSTTVIATVRGPSTSQEALKSLPIEVGNNLFIEYLSPEAEYRPAALLKDLTNPESAHHVTHIDVLIINAGAATFSPTLDVSIDSIREAFEINTLLPIETFQSLYPTLLKKSTKPKLIYMSSFLGSIGSQENTGGMPILAYGASKSASQYFARKVHFEFPDVVSLVVHPGWLKTSNGQLFADAIGAAEAPQEVESAVEDILEQIEGATRETTSGTFIRWSGETVPW